MEEIQIQLENAKSWFVYAQITIILAGFLFVAGDSIPEFFFDIKFNDSVNFITD